MRIVILGAGESGVGAALLSKKLGYDIFVSDKGAIKENFKEELNKHQIPFEENKHTEKKIFVADEIIKSPGIPDKVPLIRALREKGIPVISEIEFASKHTKATVIAITGSNGKTTTTKLTYHLLKTAGFDVGVGGNIGNSFARMVAHDPHPYYVLELSSFQLDDIQSFRPDIAMLLNLSPDHLDRYDYQMSNYVQAKFRIAMNQKTEDLLIHNAEDAESRQYLSEHPLDIRKLAIQGEAKGDMTSWLTINDELRFDFSQCSLQGRHNRFNARCSIAAAMQLGAAPEAIQTGLNTFVNVAHRLEEVATIKGITYINDSKATNVDAVYYALEAMTQPIVWMVGGIDKGNDYSPLLSLVKEKVTAMVCLGVDNAKFREVFSPMINQIEETQDTDEAIRLATALARPGDVVLLSPACSSFDLFENYAARGELFKAAVLRLQNK